MSFASIVTTALLLASYFRLSDAASAITFEPPSKGPLVQTANYTGFSNNTLHDRTVVKGKAFNRFIQIWLENTDFATAASTPAFQSLAKQGVLLTSYHSLTHPSQPNYAAAIGGDFFGMGDDDYYHIPSNISNAIDLLEEKGISWAAYQENMPEDGYFGYNYLSKNYNNASAAPYLYYYRKHNPPIMYDSVSGDPSRVNRVRNFNDFANDVVNGSLPQWLFITPNMVNDAHDTTIDFAASFLEYWLVPLLKDSRFNNEETIIILTFDENETYTIQNTIWACILGGGLPSHLRGTTDDTFYTHYSLLSTIQANWGLKSLGRQDTNKTMSNVFSFVAEKTGYKNENVPLSKQPQLNLTTVYPGALTSTRFVPFTAPNLRATGAGKGGVFIRPGLDTSFTTSKAPQPVNLTAEDKTTPYQMNTNTTSLKHIIPCTNAACT